MKTFKYILTFLILVAANSCLVDNTTDYEMNDDGPNLVTFETLTANMSILANGDEYPKELKVKLVGPTSMMDNMTGDITVTVSQDASSTAEEGQHFRIENPTLTLTKANNYLGLLQVTILTEGNAPPMDGTPEFEEWEAPVMVLKIDASGDPTVMGTGKLGKFTLAYTPPNPYAGDYESEVWYFHPTAGGTYPTDPYGGIRYADKTLDALTGRKCETWFAVWDTDKCWITVKADNSVEFTVWDEWPYDVKMGDPKNPENVSHFDPETGQIYLYYYYSGAGGDRIFWEILTPKF
jgi:hypothetical protein